MAIKRFGRSSRGPSRRPTCRSSGRRRAATAGRFRSCGTAGHRGSATRRHRSVDPISTAGRLDLGDYRGRDTLVVFWQPNCPHCQRLAEDLRRWEAEPPRGAPRLLIVSSGAIDENRALGFQSSIVLDEGFQLGKAFGAHGTPSAVLVDCRGPDRVHGRRRRPRRARARRSRTGRPGARRRSRRVRARAPPPSRPASPVGAAPASGWSATAVRRRSRAWPTISAGRAAAGRSAGSGSCPRHRRVAPGGEGSTVARGAPPGSRSGATGSGSPSERTPARRSPGSATISRRDRARRRPDRSIASTRWSRPGGAASGRSTPTPTGSTCPARATGGRRVRVASPVLRRGGGPPRRLRACRRRRLERAGPRAAREERRGQDDARGRADPRGGDLLLGRVRGAGRAGPGASLRAAAGRACRRLGASAAAPRSRSAPAGAHARCPSGWSS